MILIFSIYILFSYSHIQKREKHIHSICLLNNNVLSLIALLEQNYIALIEFNDIDIDKNEILKKVSLTEKHLSNIQENELVENLKLSQLNSILVKIESIPIFKNNSVTELKDVIAENKFKIMGVISSLKDYNQKLEASVEEFVARTDDYFLNKNILIYIFLISGLLGSVIIANFISYRITDPIERLKDNIKILEHGNYNLDNKFEVLDNDEIGDIANGIERIGLTIKETVTFTEKIGNNEFNADIDLNKSGKLASALLSMRDNLKEITEQNEIQKQQEEKRNWVIKGLAELGNILRSNVIETDDFYFNILKAIINNIGANQGGLFTINETEEKRFLQLSASYAYNRRKYLTKEIEIGEGLVGQCALEKQITNITEIPDNYIQITSGLGNSNPKNLILVPLVLNDDIFGVLEIASFEKFDDYHIDYLSQSAESIASSLSSVQINTKTKELLEKTKLQAEEIASREEEMRQNMEELEATQEESQRKTEKLEKIIEDLKMKQA